MLLSPLIVVLKFCLTTGSEIILSVVQQKETLMNMTG